MVGVVGGFLTSRCGQKPGNKGEWREQTVTDILRSHENRRRYLETILPVDGMEEPSDLSAGGCAVKPAQEIPSARDPVSGGNTTPTDLISIQPPPAAALPAGASQEVPGHSRPQNDPEQPTCPRCSLSAPDLPPSRSRLQGSSLSVHSSRGSAAGPKRPATTLSDSCFQLLLACLWCQCSALLPGLLGASACSSSCCCCCCCCRACARCCSAIREAPVEELDCHAHCHSVLFESCCEPTECLEFCLECCEICHRS